MEGIEKLLQAGTEVDPEQLKKELLRHQTPLIYQIGGLVATLQYQKSLIPQHIINPLIESTKKFICKELDKIKYPE